MTGPVMTPELRGWHLTSRLAGEFGLAPLESTDGGGTILAQAALPFGTLGALRKRGLLTPPTKSRATRAITFLTARGMEARRHLETIEQAWPGTLQRWKESAR